jgi:hypothetical protein
LAESIHRFESRKGRFAVSGNGVGTNPSLRDWFFNTLVKSEHSVVQYRTGCRRFRACRLPCNAGIAIALLGLTKGELIDVAKKDL